MSAALILAGGLGTRLRAVLGEIPKPMAPVAGRPFLAWLLANLERQGILETVLSVGYRADVIQSAFGTRFGGMSLRYVIEDQPLGTGGAIALAQGALPGRDLLVLNGDTYAALPIDAFIRAGQHKGAELTVALHAVQDTARYGAVELADDGRISAFLEKGRSGPGLINAGVYYLPAAVDVGGGRTAAFSFEQAVLQTASATGRLHGLPMVSDFIDIGIPEDYALAQSKVPALAGTQA